MPSRRVRADPHRPRSRLSWACPRGPALAGCRHGDWARGPRPGWTPVERPAAGDRPRRAGRL